MIHSNASANVLFIDFVVVWQDKYYSRDLYKIIPIPKVSSRGGYSNFKGRGYGVPSYSGRGQSQVMAQ